MNLSAAKKRRIDRRDAVIAAYIALNKDEESVSELVSKMAKKFKVTQVTIYNDIKSCQ